MTYLVQNLTNSVVNYYVLHDAATYVAHKYGLQYVLKVVELLVKQLRE